MSNHTVPTPPPDESDADRVAPCIPSIAVDLDSLVIECDDHGYFSTRPLASGLTEVEVGEAFAAHRAACKARRVLAHYPRVNRDVVDGALLSWDVGPACYCPTPWRHSGGLA